MMLDRLTKLFDEGGLEPELLRLIDGPAAGGLVMLLALLTAAGIGAVHAVGPGHGKALIGAYLAGTRGRRRDAVALGGLVAVMHSASVLALAFALHATQRVPGGDRLEPILMLVSATAVIAVGAVLLVRQVRGRAVDRQARLVEVAAPGESSGPLPNGEQAHEHHHHDLPDGVPPLSRAGVLALASSGGLLPSPAAFLVLATAIAMGRTAFGLALVAAFSLGLAATLAGVGLAVLWGRDRLGSRTANHPWMARISRAVPVVAALVVLTGGVLLAAGAALRL